MCGRSPCSPVPPLFSVLSQVGHYLAEFAITYKPCKHGRAGLGGAAAARFVPLK